MKPLQERFERNFCACNKCKAACKTMPGSLAPGDLERIQEFLGITTNSKETVAPSFLVNFQASEGMIAKRDGQYIRIPTIVPAQKPDGRCVFLSAKDECTISPVSPFGCAQFKVCDDTAEGAFQNKRRIHALANAIMASVDYLLFWAWLAKSKPMAKPLIDRKRALENELDKLRDE